MPRRREVRQQEHGRRGSQRALLARDRPSPTDLVREGGLDPPRACAHKVLSLARLPFRHSRDTVQEYWVLTGTSPRFKTGADSRLSQFKFDYERRGLERRAPVKHN